MANNLKYLNLNDDDDILTLQEKLQAISAPAANAAPSAAPSAGSDKSYVYEQDGAAPKYTQSQALQNVAQELAAAQSAKPGEYQSQYADQIQALIDGILNKPAFSYDATADPLYQQYSEQYQRLGKRAMMDTMGQSAALTGGYGNSYGATAGQQAYQNYLQELTAQIPQLQQAAYDRYQGDLSAQRQNLSTLQGAEADEYGRYRDTIGDWETQLGYITNRYDTQYGNDYDQYLAELGRWQNERDFAYQQQLDAQEQANWERQFEAAQAGRSGGGGGRSSTTKKAVDAGAATSLVGAYIANEQAKRLIPTTYKEFVALTGQSGIMTKDEWGRRKVSTESIRKAYPTYQDYLNAMWAKYN